MVPTCYATAQWPAGHLERRKTGPRFRCCDVTDLKLILGDKLAANFAKCSKDSYLQTTSYHFWFHLKICVSLFFSASKKNAGRKFGALEPSATNGVPSGLLQKLEGGAPSETSSSSITPEVQRIPPFSLASRALGSLRSLLLSCHKSTHLSK